MRTGKRGGDTRYPIDYLDTQWMLEDWNRHPTINENCDIKTREKFLMDLKLELEKNQDKMVVLAMHHPMFTYGNHGGYFALDKHLYPLQKKIPMPGLASLVVQIRSQGGVRSEERRVGKECRSW